MQSVGDVPQGLCDESDVLRNSYVSVHFVLLFLPKNVNSVL